MNYCPFRYFEGGTYTLTALAVTGSATASTSDNFCSNPEVKGELRYLQLLDADDTLKFVRFGDRSAIASLQDFTCSGDALLNVNVVLRRRGR